MARVFVCFAVGEFAVLLATAAIGLLHLDHYADRHVLLGVFSALLSCLIQVMVFTYLTITGKMMAQALHLSHAELTPLMEAKALKRSGARLLGCTVGSVIAVSITGAEQWRSGGFSGPHWLAVLAVLLVHGWVFQAEYRLITRNAALVDQVLRSYHHAVPR